MNWKPLIYSGFFILIVVSLFQTACTSDKLPEPDPNACDDQLSYTNGIKTIVDTYCAYSGCHVTGFLAGDFSSYQGMLSRLENGGIRERAIITMDMPEPGSNPENLTQEDFDDFKCWLDNGFPEN